MHCPDLTSSIYVHIPRWGSRVSLTLFLMKISHLAPWPSASTFGDPCIRKNETVNYIWIAPSSKQYVRLLDFSVLSVSPFLRLSESFLIISTFDLLKAKELLLFFFFCLFGVIPRCLVWQKLFALQTKTLRVDSSNSYNPVASETYLHL